MLLPPLGLELSMYPCRAKMFQRVFEEELTNDICYIELDRNGCVITKDIDIFKG